MKKNFTHIIIFVVSVMVVSSVSAGADKKINVVVSIPPLVDLVERVAGDAVDITVMVEPGSNLHAYEPSVAQLKKVSVADVYIAVGSGIEFERVWIDKLIALNPKMLVCRSAKNIDFIEDHDHGGVSEENDPHVWLEALNVVSMIDQIVEVLSVRDPGHQEMYVKRAEQAKLEFTKLHEELKHFFEKKEQKNFMIVHPTLGYFAGRYHLNQIAIFHEGKEPSFKQLKQYVDNAKKHQIAFIFASPYSNQKMANVIAKEVGGTVENFDPLEKNLLKNFQQLKQVFEKH